MFEKLPVIQMKNSENTSKTTAAAGDFTEASAPLQRSPLQVRRSLDNQENIQTNVAAPNSVEKPPQVPTCNHAHHSNVHV